MGAPFIGSEAVAADSLTPYDLRTRFRAIHRDVYVADGIELTAVVRAQAAWLWSKRRGVVAGNSASALHGAIRTWSDRIEDDEATSFDGTKVTNPARTALDLACRYPIGRAVAAIDALARATDLKMPDVELLADRYQGRRGIRRARVALTLVDAGAESPRESWLRLVLLRAGFPVPQTQIPVYDEYGQLVAVLDMGWEQIKVAVEYDGDHHWTDRRQFTKDINRAETLTELGWINVRVTAGDTEGGVIARVSAAWDRRA